MSVELTEVRTFLATHSPFDSLPASILDQLPSRASARYYRRGTVIMPAGETVPHMFVLRSGAVEIVDVSGNLVEHAEAGTCFGQSSIIEKRASRFTFTAIEDSLVLTFPAELVLHLVENYPSVADFFARGRISRAAAQAAASDTGPVLQVSVGDMMSKREPVSVTPDATMQQTATVMDTERVSAVLVIAEDRLLGILTDRDLRRVVAQDVPGSTPVTEIMTANPMTIGEDALAFEVLLHFVNHRIHHLPVTREGRPIGMVTSGDLMRLEKSSPVYIAGDLGKQTNVGGLALVMQRVPKLVTRLLEQDASAEDITKVVSATTEALWRRLIELGTAQFGPPPVPFCWVALGSLARQEQALASDQDHAMILSEDARPEHDEYFAQLAEFVTAGLVESGFPRCQGEVMATNPKWRAPLTTWWNHFRGWLSEPSSDAVMHASIFFDMRPIYGDRALFEHLQKAILAATPRATRFLGHLAKHADDYTVPIGFFRNFVVEREGEHRDTFDIKAGGLAGVVDVARVYALAKGLPEVATRARIQAAADAGSLSGESANNLLDAYEFMSYQRLRHQGRQVAHGEAVDNRINPDELSDFDKRHLRDAFSITSKAQSALGVAFQTQFM